jgi:uracil-DNA glycosylase family 4
VKTPPSLYALHHQVESCNRCPRLREYCHAVAQTKRRAYATEEYWGKPVPGFGDPRARLWIVGLAPGAHGANRTGRVFTGDRSGDFLFAALHRAGFANQPKSSSRNDGLMLRDCYISAAVRCAPPDNKPLPAESECCASFLHDEWKLLKHKSAILALGKIAWDAALNLARRNGCDVGPVQFAHAQVLQITSTLRLVGSYHVSQQNTFTGRLTVGMFDSVLRRASTSGDHRPAGESR